MCGGAVDEEPGACSGSEVCVAPSASPYGAICVYRSGDHTCPSGFSNKELLYGGYNDTRACSNCTCSPQNDTCSGTITRYQNTSNNCSGSAQNMGVSESGSSCIQKSSQTSVRLTALNPNPNATCARNGGALSGAAAPTMPTTVCCL